ncbi:alkylation response protein AidB-like acyl-CoA dehydrogenase [Lipingzhangella halophila]|uniref:Alkylation response protein AidB-like acyl-CoA dehydrogenase n=1 Tax=Lipingzhangella halophila TaxID=1783352 RepID=A0A7W7RFK4_9ACTN|nr:acyl-CoA dehydrogenase family protein [Lipingzhangella halophila]MBB4930506.1 alkylation response protein AidB-like acyl-CoA dehydrogenase [Lipingzhangella halophila]
MALPLADSLTDADRAFAEWVREQAAKLDTAHRSEASGVDRDLVLSLGERGLLGAVFPGASAGDHCREASAVRLCLLREHLSRVDTHAETALALQGLGSYPLVQSGTQQQRARWIPAVAAGEAVAAFALTEPDAGSDAAALALEAEPAGDGWRLNGEKTWISNAPEADFYTVFARTTPDAGARGVTAFLVPADRPGLSGEPLHMLAPHALGHLVFDAVPVAPEDVVGEVDRGFRVAMRTLDLFRPSVGAFAVGMAGAALDAATTHATGRHAFGGPLTNLQSTRHTLAEMATRTEAARLLVYAAAAVYDAGSPETGWRAAMAKLFATETAQYVVDAAVQLHGARALRRGHPLEHLYREVRAPRIYEGASEVQREIIARGMLT